jgi:hypothetical protein
MPVSIAPPGSHRVSNIVLITETALSIYFELCDWVQTSNNKIGFSIQSLINRKNNRKSQISFLTKEKPIYAYHIRVLLYLLF